MYAGLLSLLTEASFPKKTNKKNLAGEKKITDKKDSINKATQCNKDLKLAIYNSYCTDN